MFCGQCGTAIPEGGRFCPNCHWELKTESGKEKISAGITERIAEPVRTPIRTDADELQEEELAGLSMPEIIKKKLEKQKRFKKLHGASIENGEGIAATVDAKTIEVESYVRGTAVYADSATVTPDKLKNTMGAEKTAEQEETFRKHFKQPGDL